ncbi:hypothetical protein [Wolbachia endosymbiont of Aedes albopictus]|nr:hypothetical protein [Wolbachia endosymbiont of Aedes albopictus]
MLISFLISLAIQQRYPSAEHWDDTLLNRHTAAVSLDPANT